MIEFADNSLNERLLNMQRIRTISGLHTLFVFQPNGLIAETVERDPATGSTNFNDILAGRSGKIPRGNSQYIAGYAKLHGDNIFYRIDI